MAAGYGEHDPEGNGFDQQQLTAELSARLTGAEELTAQIAQARRTAEPDVMRLEGSSAPCCGTGVEILAILFRDFAGRNYIKRRDGPLLARAIKPPKELAN